MKLTECNLNGIYVVESIDLSDKDSLSKISAMGILPGTEIIFLQKKPTLLFQVYNSRFAIDNYLGEKINVRPL
ncbi:MAG: ferrous iron transport protein A [Calditerrivibrio sp.]|nr:ferrous iron transport protein A [Calditerrivibrio sp.]MCA1932511.1 ferrous iron transport protein A [Calditerrivibrio sp.]MCA1980178.1 ferrous iron transport protein A [Calditerrivibrio sp.]